MVCVCESVCVCACVYMYVLCACFTYFFEVFDVWVFDVGGVLKCSLDFICIFKADSWVQGLA